MLQNGAEYFFQSMIYILYLVLTTLVYMHVFAATCF